MPQIATDVLTVLAAATVDGCKVTLASQLDRRLYTETDKVLRAAGGKWSRSAKAHIFDGDAAELLEPIILTGGYSRIKQDFGQFDTPQDLARDVVERACIERGMRILEPSAGLGNIATEAIAVGGFVHTIEIDPRRCAKLTLRIASMVGYPAAAFCTGQMTDFLSVSSDPSYDRVVMNPPFVQQEDIRHVMHAFRFLKPGGCLIAIVSASVLFRTNRLAETFRDLVATNSGRIEPLPENSFRSMGTSVNTCIVILNQRGRYEDPA